MIGLMASSSRGEPTLAVRIEEALRLIFRVDHDGDACRVTTHCMYPSNSLVRVFVRGGVNTLVASDDGEALGEASAAGVQIRDADKLLGDFIRSRGLLLRSGVILTGSIPIDAAGVAVSHIANTAKEAAHWLYEHGGIRRKRDFRKLLTAFLEESFREQLAPSQLIGASHKLHKFHNVISFSNGRKLIVDAVSNDTASINAKAVANYDVRALNDPSIEQRIVYDDEDHWTSADLSILQMGAKIVPFSHAREVIRRVADETRGAA